MSRVARVTACTVAALAVGAGIATATAACTDRAQAAGAAPAEWTPGVAAAERYARRRQGDARFAIVDLEGRTYRFHATRTAPAASVFKAMLLAAYLRRAAVDDRSLRERDRDLLGPMIRRSDNESATRVRDIVGRSAIERLARAAEMRDFAYSEIWGLSRTSARDQALYFYRLERYIPNRHEDYARRLLASIVPSQRWGIADARPAGWSLFFKGGWGTATGRVNHQVAFLERHGQRVALAIMTEHSPSHRYGTRTLEGVAKRLLDGLPSG